MEEFDQGERTGITHEELLKGHNTILAISMENSKRLGRIEGWMSVIPQDRHIEEHDYLKIEIEARKARRDFYRSVSERLATASILGAFGLLFTALGYGLVQWIKTIRP